MPLPPLSAATAATLTVSFSDPSALRDALGWRAEHLDLKATLADAWRYRLRRCRLSPA